MPIEQAIFVSQPAAPTLLARSPGFLDEWLPWAERLCAGFGERPPGLACPPCFFVQPFGPRHVAVVQAADQPQPAALGFRLLVLPRKFYADVGGDPFFIAEQCPPPWEARGELASIEWSAGAAPYRTVAHLQTVLQAPYGPTLLGGAQALLDGGRLVFERTEPATQLVRSLWALLPSSTRLEVWPATFTFSNALGFHVVVLPRAGGQELEQYLTEEQAGDYPEGRYELALQYAIEHDHQAEVDALFARRSRSQMVRLTVALLIFLVLAVLVLNFGPGGPPAGQKGPDKKAPAEKGPKKE